MSTAPLDPDLETLRRTVTDAGGPRLVDLPVDQVRERVRTGDRLCSAGPGPAGTDLDPGRDGTPVPLRVYEPDGPPAATLLYAHGGGWVTGDLEYADELCRHLRHDAGLRVVSVDYRLAPEHPFPAGLEDLDAAHRWVRDRWEGPLAVGGDSAGGNLAAALVNRLVARGVAPAAQVLVYPALGLPGSTPSYGTAADAFPTGRADMEWFWRHLTAGSDVREPLPDLVPIHAADLAGSPPTHVVLAAHDPLHDEGAAYASRLAAAGARVSVADHPDLCHGFLRFTGASAASRDARDTLVAAVGSLCATHPDRLASGPIDAYDSAQPSGGAPAGRPDRPHERPPHSPRESR